MLQKKGLIVYLRLLRPVFHIVFILAIFWLTYKLRLVTDLIPGLQLVIPPIDFYELFYYSVFSSFLFVGLGFFRRLYRLDGTPLGYFRRFFEVWLLWFVLISFVAYFGQGFVFQSGISRLIIVWSVSLSFLVLLLFDRAWNRWLARLLMSRKTSVLCVYQSENYYQSIQKELFDLRFYDVDALDLSYWEHIDYQQYALVVFVGDFPSDFLQQEFDKVRLANQEFYHLSEAGDLDDIVRDPVLLGGMSAYRYRPSVLYGRQSVFKRTFDLLVSFVGLLFLFPLFCLIGLLIKLDSKGDVFYVQERVGRGGKVFSFVKFRSMFQDLCVGEAYGGESAWEYKKELMASDANIRPGELQKIVNDPRVTRVGRFLRKTSLDELPNLFCVFYGTMSLIGPRPHEMFEVEGYKPWQKRVLSMKPGITGYAQIHGRDSLSFDEEARYDLTYMQQWSLWMDLYVLLMTVKVVFSGR